MSPTFYSTHTPLPQHDPSEPSHHYLQPNSYPQDIKHPLPSPSSINSKPHCDPLSYQSHLERDSIHKRNIRALKLLARLLSFGLSLYGLISQALALERFLSTRNIIRENRNPWAAGSQIWPTILLLVTSGLSLLASLLILSSYCLGGNGVKSANKMSTRAGVPVTIAEACAHLAIWLSTAVAYRIGKTGKDLWGWSCDPKAQAIQNVFPEVDFGFLCNVQTASWGVSLAQVILVVVTVGVYTYAFIRERRKKAVRRNMGPLEAHVLSA